MEDDGGATPAASAASTHRSSLWMSMGLVSNDDSRRRRMSKKRESIELASLVFTRPFGLIPIYTWLETTWEKPSRLLDATIR
ncbi:unnamed protein product [Heligmosomoides polygyrus]|uniref:Uncharacterized protein n=1 Tax=Heligmosomoides polygyrus TaxID=6339 RepID=A0A183GEF0_HELPZ|nr:unnamed protein product [Heligmosomoides polygyrus]